MCLLHLVASLPTYAERLHERTKKQQTGTLHWDILVMTRQQEKKEERHTNHLGIISQPRANQGIVFSGTICAQIARTRGEPGEKGGLVGWTDQPMVREELRGKGIWRQIPLTIGSSVWEERRYDQSEDEKQMEPIIINSTHRFLCTRRTKIRSMRRRETDETYHYQINT